jgi:DNA-binding response OmpR family regulator
MHIAILDPDIKQASRIGAMLAEAGHAWTSWRSLRGMLADAERPQATLLIADASLARGLAASFVDQESGVPRLPILYLADRASEHLLAAALAPGSADYLYKPVRRAELAMRLRVLLERAYPALGTPPLRLGDYAFDVDRQRASIGDRAVELTQKEFELALLLFRNINRPLSRAYLMETVWSRDADLPSRTVDTHISRVRNKLGLRPARGFRLVPVYSYGYRLEQVAAAGSPNGGAGEDGSDA